MSLQAEGLTLREEERGIHTGILPLAKSTSVGFQKKWFGWDLPGHGVAYADCGSWRKKGCLETHLHNQEILEGGAIGKAYVKVFRRTCLRAECPICYEKWAGRESGKVEWRLRAWSGRGREIHVIVSPKRKDVYSLSFQDLRRKCYFVVRNSGVLGGSCIFHPFRQNEKTKAWYFSPHFHIIGFGWIRGTKRGYIRHGWIVKNAGIRKTVSGTALYQLSHCGVHEKYHSITWFGKLSYNRLRVPEKPLEKEVCPICGSKLRLLLQIKACSDLKNEEGEYFLNADCFIYRPKCGDYG
jgi:hypothetical protein